MSDVFINYAHYDQSIARKLADLLAQQGFSVWWDRRLLPGEKWNEIIERELTMAGCVITLWSRASVDSKWVRYEADFAANKGKLIPVRTDNMRLPIGFSQYQTLDISTSDITNNSETFQLLLSAVQETIVGKNRDRAQPKSAPGEHYVPERTRHVKEAGEPTGSPDRRFARLPASWRTRVFIAHASDDKPRMKPIIKLLVTQGFPVWIDKPHELGIESNIEKHLLKNRIRHADDWREQIRRAVNWSDVVLGFWSKQALTREREQFQYEIYMGLIQRKLRQCRLDNITEAEIGYPWRFSHMANIADYKPGHYHSELDLLMIDFVKSSILGL